MEGDTSGRGGDGHLGGALSSYASDILLEMDIT